MIQIIQSVVQNMLRHWGLTDYVAGIVIEAEPLQVQVHDRLTLGREHLLFMAGARELAAVAENGGGSFRIEGRLSLQAGDRLHLLRVLRGQKYLVLSKGETKWM